MTLKAFGSNGIGSNGEIEYHPDSFVFDYVYVQTTDGQTIDMSPLVQEIEVRESMMSFGLSVKIVVFDNLGFLQDIKFSGSELFTIQTTRRTQSKDYTKIQTYYVSEVSMYARPQTNTQVYEVSLITATTLLSTSKRVLKAYDGTREEVITKLFNDCKSDEIRVFDERGDFFKNSEALKLNPNNKTYYEVIQDIRKLETSVGGSPLYIYETFADPTSSAMVFTCHDTLLTIEKNSLIYGPYSYSPYKSKELDEYYRVLEVSSRLGVSNFKSIQDGHYLARTSEVNVFNKEYRVDDYYLYDDRPLVYRNNAQAGQDFPLSQGYTIGGEKLVDDIEQPFRYSLTDNPSSYYESSDDVKSLYQDVYHRYAKARSSDRMYDQVSHEIKIYGNILLRCGGAFDLKLSVPDNSATGVSDETFSGRYMVYSYVHKFSREGFFSYVKLKRNTIRTPGGSIGVSSSDKLYDKRLIGE